MKISVKTKSRAAATALDVYSIWDICITTGIFKAESVAAAVTSVKKKLTKHNQA